MKNIISFIGWLFLSIATANAFPILKITAPVTELSVGQTAVVTFTFSDSATGVAVPVSGFTLSDAHILGDATWSSALSGSGAVYTATIQKLVTKNTTSVVVDHKSYTATTGGAEGRGDTIGFNITPLIYMKDGNVIGGKIIVANPQPRCPLPGEFLADAAGNPSTPAYEEYYSLVNAGRGLVYKSLPYTCLVRLVGGQQFKAKVSPPNRELINVQGAHNHSTLMPLATTQFIQPLVGTTRPRVTPSNAEGCTLNGSLQLSCASGSRVYNGTFPIGATGGESRFTAEASKFLDDDPIVYPGVRGAAHLHVFYGNNSINYLTNNANILTSCVSLFSGGTINCTGYWSPSVINTATKTAILPSGINIYYKNDTANVEVFRPGLRIIAGNPQAKNSSEVDSGTKFQCFRRDGGASSTFDHFPSCDYDTYSYIRLLVGFPNCVADDGAGNQVLDSPDHRSHLSINVGGAGLCGGAFPHKISSITQNVDYTLLPGDNTATWRLSSDNYSTSDPGGYSLHADWLNGWNPYWIERVVRSCNNGNFNCGQDYVGMSDGVGISNVVTTGNKAVITTVIPHLLAISDPTTGAYPNQPQPNSESMLLAQISGFTGADAALYNFDINKISGTKPDTTKQVMPAGVQRIKVLTANTIEFTLYGTPTTPINGAVDPAVVKIRWGESTCQISSSNCNTAYSEYFYGNK